VTTLRAREQDIAAKGDVERLHEPDLDGRHGRDSTRLARHAGAARNRDSLRQGAHYLFDELVKIDGVRTVSTQHFFREFALHLGRDASGVLLTMANDVSWGACRCRLDGRPDPSIEGDLEDVLLVTVTERRTKEEIDRYVEVLRKAVGQ